LIIEKIETPAVLEVDVSYFTYAQTVAEGLYFLQDLDATIRGAGGFGSTGGHGALST